MVGLTELESVTSCVSSRRSNQLSYKPMKPDSTIPRQPSLILPYGLTADRLTCQRKGARRLPDGREMNEAL